MTRLAPVACLGPSFAGMVAIACNGAAVNTGASASQTTVATSDVNNGASTASSVAQTTELTLDSDTHSSNASDDTRSATASHSPQTGGGAETHSSEMETATPNDVSATSDSPSFGRSTATTNPSSNAQDTSAPDVATLVSEFVAFWDFENDDAGTITDANGGAPLTLDGATVDMGPAGQHAALSGDNTSASADLAFDTSANLSISAWVKLDTLGDFNTFVGVDGAQVSALFLQKRSDDRLSFATFPSDSTGATPCVTTAEIQPRNEEWYHVVATRDATTGEQRIYVDGVLSGKSRCTDGVFAADGAVSVGRGLYDGQPSDWMSGGIDELGLVQRVLTPEEVFRLYRASRPNANHYLFAYFVEVSQGRGDGLRLAHSHDGLHWGAIGSGKVFMPPSVGGGSFRDPHLMRDPNGTYHLVWTTTCVPWAESNCVQDRGLGHATSSDLVEWSEADYIEIALNVEHVWAPETFYDEVNSRYVVFWSSPIDQNPSASDPHDIYYLTTADFETFSEPAILYSQPGRNFIDATIKIVADGSYLMLLKDEADGQKNLRALRSETLIGADSWTAMPSPPLTGNYAAEGPSFLERNGELYTYFDKYGEGTYGALRATTSGALDQASAWQDISDSVFFPGVRHGTPIEVPWNVFERVASTAGN